MSGYVYFRPSFTRNELARAAATAIGLVSATLVTVGVLPAWLALPAALFVKAAWTLDRPRADKVARS